MTCFTHCSSLTTYLFLPNETIYLFSLQQWLHSIFLLSPPPFSGDVLVNFSTSVPGWYKVKKHFLLSIPIRDSLDWFCFLPTRFPEKVLNETIVLVVKLLIVNITGQMWIFDLFTVTDQPWMHIFTPTIARGWVCSSSVQTTCTRAIDRFPRLRQQPTWTLANQNSVCRLCQSGCLSGHHA